jgi:hypothetical protein
MNRALTTGRVIIRTEVISSLHPCLPPDWNITSRSRRTVIPAPAARSRKSTKKKVQTVLLLMDRIQAGSYIDIY